MKWFISCSAVILIGLAFLIGMWSGVAIYYVHSSLSEGYSANLLILYGIDTEENNACKI
jgi:hypothetical protein